MKRNSDKNTKIHIIRAPIEVIRPYCVGIIRATAHGAVLTEGVTEPPLAYHDARLKRPDFCDLAPGFLVSTPKGHPELTLIECPPASALDNRLQTLDPAIEIMTIWSKIENQQIQKHGFELRRDGRRVRYAEIEKGWTDTRWTWRDEGPLQSFEDPTVYQQRSIPKRMTKHVLHRYAAAFGVDPEKHLMGRALENAVLITDGQIMSENDLRLRTRAHQKTFERVLALGIGQPEPREDQYDSARKLFRDGKVKDNLDKKVQRALFRLRSKDTATVRHVIHIYENYVAAIELEFGRHEVPFGGLLAAIDIAGALDGNSPEYDWLLREKTKWERVVALQARLVCHVPDGHYEKWPSDAKMNALIFDVLDDESIPAEAKDLVLSTKFADLFLRCGIPMQRKASFLA